MAQLKKQEIEAAVDEFNRLWQKLASFISSTVSERNPTIEKEKEFLQLTGILMQKAAQLSDTLNLDRRFMEMVVDFLGDLYSLRSLLDYKDFQIGLFRERWNGVQLELGRIKI